MELRQAIRAVRANFVSPKSDAVAGLVLGVQSIPDGLATGVLAGVNPLAGLYAYLVGTVAGSLSTSSVFMVVQGTGAMAIIIADVPTLHSGRNPGAALLMLSVLTGVIMVVAGVFKFGAALRFVSNAVMVGFINAVGVNIILGQLTNLTGYSAPGANRVVRSFNTFRSPSELHWQSIVIGLVTIAGILLLERTPIGSLGLVVSVIATSAFVYFVGLSGVATLHGLGVNISGLPRPTIPRLGLSLPLVLPALSLAFVGLVQGAGVSANFLNPDGTALDASRDFVGQGVANIASGVFQGMPVGGSVSASAISKQAGARTRLAPLVAGLVMAVVIVALGGVVAYIAMPALAGLLILVGARTIKLDDVWSVWRTGTVQKVVFVTTFILTMIIPLQYAVLVGVAVSIVLYVVKQSNQVTIKQLTRVGSFYVVEVDPPTELPASKVVVLQPYGSLFFAAAPVFEAALPAVSEDSRSSVVILRLRGRTELGTTFMDVLLRYAISLRDVDSRLVLVSANARISEQLDITGITDVIGASSVYEGDERVGATLQRAYEDALAWVEARRTDSGPQNGPA